MTTPLLENELVRKYFSCDAVGCEIYFSEHKIKADECMAFRVLQAMQEPIKHGDVYLHVQWDGVVFDGQTGWSSESQPFHPKSLRLPDAFQKREKCCCGESNVIHRTDGPCYYIEKKSSPVEHDVNDILVAIDEGIYTKHYFQKRLESLVALCKREFEKESK